MSVAGAEQTCVQTRHECRHDDRDGDGSNADPSADLYQWGRPGALRSHRNLVVGCAPASQAERVTPPADAVRTVGQQQDEEACPGVHERQPADALGHRRCGNREQRQQGQPGERGTAADDSDEVDDDRYQAHTTHREQHQALARRHRGAQD